MFDCLILLFYLEKELLQLSFGHYSDYLHQIAFLISLFACHSFVPTLFWNLMKNSFFFYEKYFGVIDLLTSLRCVLSKFCNLNISANGNLLEVFQGEKVINYSLLCPPQMSQNWRWTNDFPFVISDYPLYRT